MSIASSLQKDVGLIVNGVRLSTVAAGIRYPDRDDICLIEVDDNAKLAAVFTQNQFCAAPVVVAKEHLQKDPTRYLLINSGNANAGTGDEGLRAARETCRAIASMAGCAMSQVLPFSTGVIGEDLPIIPFQRKTPSLIASLKEDCWAKAAAAIMTTDTRPKLCSYKVVLSSGEVAITGISKGSGMIRPDMATMLAYVATDALIGQTKLQEILQEVVQPSFNSITVDGDTSTNDACVLIASGVSAVDPTLNPQDMALFEAALLDVFMHLAREIVRDGEGATKLVEVLVQGAKNRQDAQAIAYTIAHSPLVKTAWFASDPNWGRTLAAVGRAGVTDLNLNAVKLYLDDVCIVSNGGRAASYQEVDGQAVMDQAEFNLKVELGMGDVELTVLTCDFSYDYVKINAEYRS